MDIVRTNKHMNHKYVSPLKSDRQIKLGKYDFQACNTLSSTNQMKNKSLILLSKYHDQRVAKDVEKQVKVPGPTEIHEYYHYMEEVDLSKSDVSF